MNDLIMTARRRAAAITGNPPPSNPPSRIYRSCTIKVKFNTFEEADAHPKQKPYFCLHCGYWHRTTIR